MKDFNDELGDNQIGKLIGKVLDLSQENFWNKTKCKELEQENAELKEEVQRLTKLLNNENR